MKRINLFIPIILGAFASLTPARAYSVWDYWRSPANTIIHRIAQIDGSGETADPHGYWNSGGLWNSDVEMQGNGSSFQEYDMNMVVGSTMYYIGTFPGNADSVADAAYFLQPIAWMSEDMSVNDTLTTTHQYCNLSPSLRQQTNSYTVKTAETWLFDHYDSYTIPETGVTYYDVIYFGYTPDINADALEEYWCANGVGQIRSHIDATGLTSFAWPDADHGGDSNGYGDNGVETDASDPDTPETPWYSPFATSADQSYGATYIYNGSFEGGSSESDIPGWDAYEMWDDNWLDDYYYNFPLIWRGELIDQPPSIGGLDEAGPNQLIIAGDPQNNDMVNYVTSENSFPVIPGATYCFSAWIYRDDPTETAILTTWGDGFSGPTITASGDDGAGSWQYVSENITIPGDGNSANVALERYGEADNSTATFFDDVRFTIVSLPDGWTPPGI